MRVIGGRWRGRTIYPPKGTDTRPTTDRVRESLMSILMSARGGIEGACVLDAFAGSGALGIEALSRGAQRATFCETNRNALQALQRNLDIVGVGRTTDPVAIVRRGDCLMRPPIDSRNPYDLVFLDPPYAMPFDEVFLMLAKLNTSDSLHAGVIAIYEHSAQTALPDVFCASGVSWARLQKKRFGETSLDILRKDMA